MLRAANVCLYCPGYQTTKFPRFNIALVDKLPGGLEAENPVLKTNRPQTEADDSAASATEKGKEKGEATKPTTWFEHVRAPVVRGSLWLHALTTMLLHHRQQNLRDERVECFAAQLEATTYVYEYTARATTPGMPLLPC
jgi:uncharacterized protein YfaS (alpha-2-macroglobulin family)